jgi:hypothetical protein
MSSAMSASNKASVPDDTPMAYAAPQYVGAQDELLAFAHLFDQGHHVGADLCELRLKIQ